MKHTALVLATLLAAGCAANRGVVVTQPSQPAAAPAPLYQPAQASALVFDSEVMPDFPLAGLDRTAREASAFLGYDDVSIESYYIVTDDGQSNSPFQDNYQRDAIYAKVGTRTR